MMINKRLIQTVPESKKHAARNVAAQWTALICNIAIIFTLGGLLGLLYRGHLETSAMLYAAGFMSICVICKAVCTKTAAKESYLASKSVKKKLRELIFKKLLSLGGRYTEKATTAEILQASVEGVEQLETYFGAYLPQFFYSLLAPLTLFAALSVISVKSAVILLICVPLIPVSIMLVQKFAKKLLAKYWGQYTKMGDSFLENLQGLTTLKVYQADQYKHQKMNEEAEKFRKITMKVLTMQLNSITVMDLVAYGGAALGVIMAVTEFQGGSVSIAGCFIIIMLAADFFLPLRALGSYFHVAMNGMAASDRIFALLDLEEKEEKGLEIGENKQIVIKNLSFSYDGTRRILRDINMDFPERSLTAIVGESGSGKSTVASLLMGMRQSFDGEVCIGGMDIRTLSDKSIMENIMLISLSSYIFKGTVRDNLSMGSAEADDEVLWSVLEKVNLKDFISHEGGLEMELTEQGGNLSGGQRQRLALARALLHDSGIYIFDEATSNIDIESETDIMAVLAELAKRKTVILISHRLANVTAADQIYVMDAGSVIELGGHEVLLRKGGKYASLWNTQTALENFEREETADEEKKFA